MPYHNPVPLSWNLGTLTFWSPLGHSRSVMGLLYLFCYCRYIQNIHAQIFFRSRHYASKFRALFLCLLTTSLWHLKGILASTVVAIDSIVTYNTKDKKIGWIVGRMDTYRGKETKWEGKGCFSFSFFNRIRIVTTEFLTLASYKFHWIGPWVIAWVRTDRQYNFITGLLQGCDNA